MNGAPDCGAISRCGSRQSLLDLEVDGDDLVIEDAGHFYPDAIPDVRDGDSAVGDEKFGGGCGFEFGEPQRDGLRADRVEIAEGAFHGSGIGEIDEVDDDGLPVVP